MELNIMKMTTFKANIFLLLAAAIWGFAFVAQKVGAEYLDAFSFNGIRFTLGSLSLIPLIIYNNKKSKQTNSVPKNKKSVIPAGIIAGTILFSAASLQQLGMTSNSSGKAAFITGLYIVLVPVFGIFLKQYIKLSGWLGVIVAITGLYFLCIKGSFSVSKYDVYLLIGSFFWTAHILVIDHFTKKVDALRLSCSQFIVCSVLSLTCAFIFEKITLGAVLNAAVPVLYGGLCSVGIAYTLQVIGQKYARPAPAAIILSMETVFASIGGFIILNENLGARGYLGCALMLTGMLLSQLQNFSKKEAVSFNSTIEG
jgi:drug/metabolite transporter (DMT)-like permease